MEHRKYKLGYVDEESQWISKFQRALSEAFEIEVFQLDQTIGLEDLVQKILASNLDCLIVDYELKETAVVPYNGDEIVDRIRQLYPYFPMFIITSKEEEYVLTQVEDNEIVRLKEELTDRPKILTQRIENKINNYYTAIEEARKTIEDFTQLKNNGKQLDAQQEEMLYEKYLFLEKVYPEEKILPDSLSAPESVNVLNQFVEETRKALEELKKLNS